MSGTRESTTMNDQQPWQTPTELQGIELQFSLLVPREDRLDRERLLFLAGQASVELPRGRWAWPVSLTAMTALAATLLVILLTQPTAAPPALHSTEKTLAEIQQDFAQRLPPRRTPRGVSTATIFREEELSKLLNGGSTSVANNDNTISHSTEQQLNRTILTPSSWDQLFEDAPL